MVLIDHFSKYTMALPLPDKESATCAVKLGERIGIFGIARIVQCDNGTEFRGVLKEMLKQHGVVIINGRPRHPQSQGCVERQNRTLKGAIRKMILESGTSAWSSMILEVVMSLNTLLRESTGKTPYQIVFKQKPLTDVKATVEDRANIEVRDESDDDANTDICSDDDGTCIDSDTAVSDVFFDASKNISTNGMYYSCL